MGQQVNLAKCRCTAMPTVLRGYAAARCINDEQELVKLNQELAVLMAIFPHILPEVFREMLMTFQGESGIYTVVDQLLNHCDQWVRGRWRKPDREVILLDNSYGGTVSAVPLREQFRKPGYKRAVRNALGQEFASLHKSTVDAVAAEQNFSYIQSRPILKQIAAKSWRHAVHRFFSRWRSAGGQPMDQHFMLLWPGQPVEKDGVLPTLRDTGDAELDQELHQALLAPLLEKSRLNQTNADWALANEINEINARNVDALYECECCCVQTTFEQMATCTTGEHVMCFRCIRAAASEALYGQSWSRNIDHGTGQIACLAPFSNERCPGWVPQCLAERAMTQSYGGSECWLKFQSRLSDEALLKSQVPLIRCPFCEYAEVDDLYLPPERFQYRLCASAFIATIMLLPLIMISLPLIIGVCALSYFCFSGSMQSPPVVISRSIQRLARTKYRPSRFQCRSPTCALPSCLSCRQIWRDPHLCFESARLSLRKTIEAARTAAVKRTCPRCGLGFVKDSGCNKLTCICGYMMCYRCRQGLGDSRKKGDGYRHFCQHFRPAGGDCRECDRCDLYRAEDEDQVVRRAGEEAERRWRESEGLVGPQSIEGSVSQLHAESQQWHRARWTVQSCVDWCVEKAVVV